MLKGVDLSKHNGIVDFSQLKDVVDFVIIRGGYGSLDKQKDEQFERNYSECKKYGIPVGMYLYSYAQNLTNAENEANFILRLIKDKQFEYPIIFDFEDPSQTGLTKQERTDIAFKVLETVENAGNYVMLYANRNWLTTKLDMTRLNRFDTWLAEWVSANYFEVSQKPKYTGNYGIWQFTSKGSVKGVQGNCDLNFAYKDYPNIIKRNGFNGFSKIENKPEQEDYIIYTVKKNDNLWNIATKYLGSGTRWTEIQKLNNIEGTIIYPNQKLKIPTK